MALPMMQETTELPDWMPPHLQSVPDVQWATVDEPVMNEWLTEILGYATEAIKAGTTTQPAPNAFEKYSDLMATVLGYVLVEVPEVSPSTQEALDEIASGLTTVVRSTEEFEKFLRDSDPTA